MDQIFSSTSAAALPNAKIQHMKNNLEVRGVNHQMGLHFRHSTVLSVTLLLWLFVLLGCAPDAQTSFTETDLKKLWKSEEAVEFVDYFPFIIGPEKVYIVNVRIPSRGRNGSMRALLIKPQQKTIEEIGCGRAIPVNNDLIEMMSFAAGGGCSEGAKQLAYFDGQDWVIIHSAYSESNDAYGCAPGLESGCNVKIVNTEWYFRNNIHESFLLEWIYGETYKLDYNETITTRRVTETYNKYRIDGINITKID